MANHLVSNVVTHAEHSANFELLKGYYRISINNIAGDPITRLWVQPQAQILKLKALVEQVNGTRLLQQRYYSDSGEELLDCKTAEECGLNDGSCVHVLLCTFTHLHFLGLYKHARHGKQFDCNGVLYFLGSGGRTHEYRNPHESGKVVASISSVQPRPREEAFPMVTRHGSVERFVMHSLDDVSTTRNFTKDEPNQWMSVDLGEGRLLVVDHYCLRHGRATNMFRLRHWCLEGSLDGSAWVTLKEHVDDDSLPPQSYSVSNWAVPGVQEALRYFRVLQIGLNSDGSNRMYCAGIELYGSLYSTCD
jgi:hypothetical protein